MTWDEILILLIMVMGLFAIDMLVAKFNLKAGRIVAVLTFFILFPLGLIAGVVALICMNSKGKQRKISITALFKNVVFRATLFAIILLYLIDMILLKVFPDATFPVVLFSFCFFPLSTILIAKALDYLKEKLRKPKRIDFPTTFQNDNQEQKNITATSRPATSSSYATPQDDPYAVSDDYFLHDPDYQDYLQGNIRPSRYVIERKVADNGQEYTTLKSEQTELAAFYREQNEKAAETQATKMIELVIPEGTTEIKECEFESRKDIISVVIPESVKRIGKRAFFCCENLEKVTILRGVIDIGDNSFSHCTKLTSIEIPKSIKEIRDSAFSYCENLTGVTVESEGGTRVGNYAFRDCHNLSSVKLHEGVITIGVMAFQTCRNLSSVAIPDSVVWFGGCAFEYCVSLTHITLPKNLNSMGDSVFSGCVNLNSIDIPENIIPNLCGKGSLSGCLALKYFKIPHGVTEIANGMFSDCKNLTMVEIPDTVERIGNHAFSGCKKLEHVNLPIGVKTIGEDAFKGCDKISDDIKRTVLLKTPRIGPISAAYNTPYDDPQCDDNFNPDKYNYELRVAGNGQAYYARIN